MKTAKILTMIGAGTTGMAAVAVVKSRLARESGDALFPQFAFVNIETASFLPDDEPGTTHAAIGEDFSGLSADDFLNAPAWMHELPASAFVNLGYGAAKKPVNAKVGVDALRERIARALDAARPKGHEFFCASRDLLDKHPDLTLSKQPLVVIAGAAGGSTAPAIVLSQVDLALAAPGSGLVCVVLIGPRAGASFDDWATEDANAVHLLAALQTRQIKHARLWCFLLDGALHERDAVLQSAGELVLRLAIAREGEIDLPRLLLDGFAVSARNHGAPVVCRVNAAVLSADANKARARVFDQLLAALDA